MDKWVIKGNGIEETSNNIRSAKKRAKELFEEYKVDIHIEDATTLETVYSLPFYEVSVPDLGFPIPFTEEKPKETTSPEPTKRVFFLYIILSGVEYLAVQANGNAYQFDTEKEATEYYQEHYVGIYPDSKSKIVARDVSL